MAIARYRFHGPEYEPQHMQGQVLIWDYINKRYVVGTTYYYPNSVNRVKNRYDQCWDETHPGPPFREGGPLQLRQIRTPFTTVASGVWMLPNLTKYVGSFALVNPNLDAYADMIDDSSAATFGPEAWKKFRPTRSSASVGQFIAELRDFPSMWKFQLKKFQDLGKNFLNWQFGWKPFISDILKAYRLMCKIEKRIAFIRKNNGKWLRRGGTIRSDATTIGQPAQNWITPLLGTGFYPGGVRTNGTCELLFTDRVWFKASMKYYIKNLDVDSASDMWSSELLRRLYGLEITPFLLYELMPWSWLHDWFNTYGDFLSNLCDQNYDNLVAKYAFVMRQRKYTFKCKQVQPMVGGKTINLDISGSHYVTYKERAEGSPFGLFGSWPDFSAVQVAILAALGISRIR